jgi:SPP1 gp7 family putative phage head morphogenesis protein
MSELIEISKAVDAVYKAISAPRRRQQQHRREVRRNEPKIARASREYLEYLQKEINKGSRRLRGKTPAKIADSLVNWEELITTGALIYEEPMREIYIIGSRKITASRIKKQGRTDPIGIASIEWAETYSNELVTEITNQTRLALVAIIGTEIAQGSTLQQMARQIRNTVGMNARQQAALQALQARMVAAEAEVAAIQKALERYTKRAIRYRAMMIARTETARALSAGTLDAYGRMGIKKVQWVADPECCDICNDNNGKIFTIQEAGDLIPAHPNCECVFVMALE